MALTAKEIRKLRKRLTPKPKEIKAARQRFALPGSGITEAQAAAGALIYYTLSGWQRLEAGERAMHPALWEYWQLRAAEEKRKRDGANA